jgi:dynein regulatory complex protein 1
MRWADIMERQLPQELASELGSQQAACNTVLQGKEKIAARLEHQMRNKEEEYLKALASQKEDINTLLTRMKAQFEEMRDGYEQALVDVEGAFLSERSELLGVQKREIDALFDTRKQMEGKYVEERLAREDQWANDLYDMQAADMENYARLKAKLEGDVSILEQQLEHMKVSTHSLSISCASQRIVGSTRARTPMALY